MEKLHQPQSAQAKAYWVSCWLLWMLCILDQKLLNREQLFLQNQRISIRSRIIGPVNPLGQKAPHETSSCSVTHIEKEEFWVTWSPSSRHRSVWSQLMCHFFQFHCNKYCHIGIHQGCEVFAISHFKFKIELFLLYFLSLLSCFHKHLRKLSRKLNFEM